MFLEPLGAFGLRVLDALFEDSAQGWFPAAFLGQNHMVVAALCQVFRLEVLALST